MNKCVLVADLGGTKIAAARVISDGRISDVVKTATPPEGGDAVVQALLELLSGLPGKGVHTVGVAVPGLAYPGGEVWAPNIRGWERMPLGAILKRHFRMPALVESDRNACIMGEAWRGAARNCRDAVFVAVGTGIGAGIISGGSLLRGHAGLAGCLGWVTVRRTPSRSLADSERSAEDTAAGPAIGRAATRLWGESTSARDVVARARRGDRAAVRLLAEAGRDLGVALAGVVSILNPEIIVIGGGVASAGSLLLSPARETMKRLAQPLAARQVRVVRSKLGARAGLLGMARMALDAEAGRVRPGFSRIPES
ncbi:MAG: ROK family protein [Terriglobia bacterium]